LAAAVLGTVLLLAAAAPAAEQRKPPNVILILADDLGWADLRCYGSTFHETPNLDRLAAQGMRFTQAYAACPVCSPTRASILTGQYPQRYEITTFIPGRADMASQKLLQPAIRRELPLEAVTLAEALAPAGYRSASMGKWHLGGQRFWPDKQGFALNVGGTATGSPPGGYFKFATPTLAAADQDEYLTDRLTDEAVRFIEQNRDGPFFLYLPHYAVHIPLQTKRDLLERYRAKLKGAEPAGPQENPVYSAVLHSLDEGVGRVMAKLDKLGIADDTVVVFTSDNGGLSAKEGPDTPATSNAPLREGKGHVYEGGVRVPWIVRWPGVVKAGSVCEEPVCSIDLFPTVLELAGAKPPEGQKADGVSLLPLLKQTGKPERRALYWHFPHYSNQGGVPAGAVRDGKLKLVEFYEDGRLELYDVAADPGETKDLSSEMPDEAARLARMLAEWRKAVGAKMPTPNPDYAAAVK
jgi:arylsulfatase A-like enzyme